MAGLLLVGCGESECAVPEGVYAYSVEAVTDQCGLGLIDGTVEFSGGGMVAPAPDGCTRTSTYAPGACGFTVIDECTDEDGPYTFRVDVDISDGAERMDGVFRLEARFADGSTCESVFDLSYEPL